MSLQAKVEHISYATGTRALLVHTHLPSGPIISILVLSGELHKLNVYVYDKHKPFALSL